MHAQNRTLITYEQLRPGDNYRSELQGIPELATSIASQGIIENLVVRPIETEDSSIPDQRGYSNALRVVASEAGPVQRYRRVLEAASGVLEGMVADDPGLLAIHRRYFEAMRQGLRTAPRAPPPEAA